MVNGMTDFTKTLIWLMDSFSEVQFRLEEKYVKQVMKRLVPNFSFNSILESELVQSREGNIKRLLESLLMISDLYYWLISLEERSLTINELNSIRTQLAFSNASLTEYLSTAFNWDGKDSEIKIRQLSNNYTNFLNILVRDRVKREELQKIKPEEDILNEKCYKRVAKSDVHLLETHIEYLLLIMVWMCIIESPFYDTTMKKIAQGVLGIFCDLFSNSRIEEMYMEPNYFYSEKERGTHTTTKCEIFFVQANGDRYCLRLDFPHTNVDFVHFNLHEPFKDAAFPITLDEYGDLSIECKIILRDFFYFYGERMWFRNDFEHLVEKNFSDNEFVSNCLLKKYQEQKHYPFLENKYTEEDVTLFWGRTFDAIATLGMENSIYKKPKEVDVNKQFHLITLRENIKLVNYTINRNRMYELFEPEKFDEKLENSIKQKFLTVLTNYFGNYSPDDLKKCSIDELLELIELE